MKKLFSTMLITLLCTGALVAEPPERVQKVIAIKHGNLGGILKTLRDLGPSNNVVMSNSDAEHIILSGTKDAVAGFEEIIKQLDVPPVVKKDVEMTGYMLVAASQSAANATAMPTELDPVVKQLKSIFNYKNFVLLDSFVLRSRDGEKGDNSGFVPALDSNVPAGARISYLFRYNRVIIDGGESGKLIRFDGLRLELRVPLADSATQYHLSETGISTDVDVPEGKKVVVGKTSGIAGADSALILVISAKVVD